MVFLLRVGSFGHIGRFSGSFNFKLGFGQKVICRTVRGLEVAEFLERSGAWSDPSDSEVDGELVRVMTDRDRMLEERLNRDRIEAIDACQALISEKGIPAAILDAELTFDGKGLYFYFAGESGPEIDEVTEVLAQAYDAKVRFSEFAKVLDQGCGPDCGTSSGAGCQESGCTSCSLKSACKTPAGKG